jgi:signal peptidase I
MTLNNVQPFLDEAFKFLRDRQFSVSHEDWIKFCGSHDMSLDKLQSAKLELFRQFKKIDDDSEQLEKIFYCDPFDTEIIKSLRGIWYEKADKQPDPFKNWCYDISVHLLNFNMDSSHQEFLPSMTQVSPLPKKTTFKQKTSKNLPSAPLNKKESRLKQIISTKRWIFITPIIYSFLLLKIFSPLVITLPIYQFLMIVYFTLCKKNKFSAIGISIIISIISFIIVRTFIAEARYIVGDSMLPTIQNADRVIVDKTSCFFTSCQSKDIVIFEMAGQNIISRIIGISGDKISLKEGIIYVNDIPLKSINNIYHSFNQFTVPSNSYLVLADNLRDNPDGSYWGIVPRSKIIGKVSGNIYPFDRFGLLK